LILLLNFRKPKADRLKPVLLLALAMRCVCGFRDCSDAK
jgi:hypothetical protein